MQVNKVVFILRGNMLRRQKPHRSVPNSDQVRCVGSLLPALVGLLRELDLVVFDDMSGQAFPQDGSI